MSADNTQETSQTTENQSNGKKDALAETLAQVTEQLRAINESVAAQGQVIQSIRQPASKEEPTEDDLYNPQALLNRAGQVMESKLREERAKDAKIFELSQDYPEIKTDSKIRNDILAAQRELPEAIRDTALGYETAVLKAVTKAGLVAKSKRQTVDDDMSMGSGSSGGSSGGSRNTKRKKVSEETLMVAQLMGRDINDPETLKRLEEASNRDSYSRYR